MLPGVLTAFPVLPLRRFKNIVGSWGDIPEDLVLSLYGPRQLNLHWAPPSTRITEPSAYVPGLGCGWQRAWGVASTAHVHIALALHTG